MNYLTKTDNGVVLAPEAANKLLQIDKIKKELKTQEDALRQAILEEMQNSGVLKVETEELSITYVDETYQERLDSKKLKAEEPETYDKYVKMSPVKAQIKVKIKDGKVED